MFNYSSLSSREECASSEEDNSLNLELILEPAVDDSSPHPTAHQLTLSTSASCHTHASPAHSAGSPTLPPPLSLDTFLQQLRSSHFKRRGSVSLKLKIARRRRDCSICQEWVEEKSVVHNLHCRHTFHQHCLLQWAQSHNSCPLCRHPLR